MVDRYAAQVLKCRKNITDLIREMFTEEEVKFNSCTKCYCTNAEYEISKKSNYAKKFGIEEMVLIDGFLAFFNHKWTKVKLTSNYRFLKALQLFN